MHRTSYHSRGISRRAAGSLLAGLVFSARGGFAEEQRSAPRLNQVQVLGSHNSYKEAIDKELLEILKAEAPEDYAGLEYSHVALGRQLDLGLRILELDVYRDPEGGRYAHPFGLEILREKGLTPARTYDPHHMMRGPGLKVLHVQDIDFRTHAYTFRDGLRQIRTWSEAHPGHLPIAITMNAKDDVIDRPNFTRPLPFDERALDAVDAEIRESLPPEKLITPDSVRGSHKTLEAAVLAGRWPTIEASRGKFLFVLDEKEEKLEAYRRGHPSLRGRAMFATAPVGEPEAAFCIVNDPKKDFATIQKLVRSGYLVRTRADADTVEARDGDYSRMKAAFASGAQFVSTDYYLPDTYFGRRFHVSLPGGRPGRWNPLFAREMQSFPEPEAPASAR